jgi:hypothetical protein
VLRGSPGARGLFDARLAGHTGAQHPPR